MPALLEVSTCFLALNTWLTSLAWLLSKELITCCFHPADTAHAHASANKNIICIATFEMLGMGSLLDRIVFI
jgi:hypothetical protein